MGRIRRHGLAIGAGRGRLGFLDRRAWPGAPRSGCTRLPGAGRRRGHGQRDLPLNAVEPDDPRRAARTAGRRRAAQLRCRPPAGQLRSGLVASLAGVRVSLVSGGSPASGRSHWCARCCRRSPGTVPRPLSCRRPKKPHRLTSTVSNHLTSLVQLTCVRLIEPGIVTGRADLHAHTSRRSRYRAPWLVVRALPRSA